MNISIKQAKRNSHTTKNFEDKEWRLADIEHYGEPRPFVKKSYKFVARNGKDKIVGILDLDIEANVSYLENLLVSSKIRGQGIGRKLIQHAEKFAKDKGCTKIWLDTDEDWQAAEFYKKMGYAVTGTHEQHYLGKRALIFTKFFE